MDVGSGDVPTGAVDLGDVALLPGLVNAHTHLEFSDIPQPIGHPGIELSDWVSAVVSSRGAITDKQKQQAIIGGLTQSRDFGVRLIGEIATPPCQYPEFVGRPDLVTFAEVLGLSQERADERTRAAIEHLNCYDHGAWSPHAPYSTTPDLVRHCVRHAADSGRPVAMHVAESPAERELIQQGTGRFAEALQSMGVWREGLFPWAAKGFVDLIKVLAGAPSALLIHGNDLREAEMDQVAANSNLTVVFCPRTHSFFGHDPHPLDQLLRRGIPVALGTDSRASNPDLSLWREVQHVMNHRTDIAPELVIEMATCRGAEALCRQDVGRIRVGCRPGLGVVRTRATRIEQLWRDFADNDYVPVRSQASS